VVGAAGEQSPAKGVNGSQDQSTAPMDGAGAVYAFALTGTTWSQRAYIKASNTAMSMFFGNSVSLSSDASTLAIDAPQEASNATGIDGDQSNTADPSAGAVYVFD
jgi:hypothetical protein